MNVIIGLHRGKIVVDPTADTEYVFISRHTVVNTNDDFVKHPGPSLDDIQMPIGDGIERPRVDSNNFSHG